MQSNKLGKLFARYTVPTVIAMMVSGLYHVVDGIFVGHYIGANGLAAISLIWPWISMPLGFGLLVGVGIGSVSSIAQGAKNLPRAKKAIGQLGIWTILPGILFGIVLYFGSPYMLKLQGASGEVAQMSIDFLRIIAIGSPLMIGGMAVPFLIRNLNAPRLATIAMVIGALINIVLDYLFIVYLEWSIKGVALAYIFAESSAMTVGLCYIFSKRSPVQVRKKHFVADWQLAKMIGLNGSSSLFMYSYLGAVALLHHVMLLKYGSTQSVAAYSIVGYLLTIYYLLAEGVANGMQPIISNLYGARKNIEVKRILKMAMLWGVGIGLLFTLLLQIVPGFFVNIFASHTDDLQQKSIHAIRFNLFALFLEGLFVISASFLQALGQGRKALFITVGNMLIQVPFLLIMPPLMGIDGVWLAMPVSSLVLMIFVIWLLHRQFKTLDRESVADADKTKTVVGA